MIKRNLRKKFRGFINPKDFIPHFHHVHKDRHSSFLGPLVGLRQPAHVVSKPSKEKEIYLERIVYVGCVHGGSDEIYHRLKLLVKYPPDYLIFTGDITGSREIEQLKKKFYDWKENNSPHPPLTLRGGKRELDKFEYFGDWAATLSKEKREKLLSTLEENASHLLKIIQKIKKQGTKIFIIEGNWDNPEISGVKAIAGKDIKNVFDTQKYFRDNGYQLINHLETLKTKTTLHIFLPYITLLHFDQLPKQQIREVEDAIKQAREDGKTIVMIGHAEANWRIHNLSQKNSPVGDERKIVIKNFGRAMALFAPDEIIYPHQHARIRDEKGDLIDINAKYVLEVYHDGVRLVDNPSNLSTEDKQILATFIPLGFLAEEDFVGSS